MANNNHGPQNLPKGVSATRKFNGKAFKRTIAMLFKSYPVLLPVAIVCIVFSAIVSTMPAIFNQQILEAIEQFYRQGDWSGAKEVIIPKIIVLASLYVISLLSVFAHTQLMAFITQGFLGKIRKTLFSKIQNLPIKYFDTNKHGDIMSHYTNDIDSIRQLVSQSIPTLLQAGIIVCTVFFIMMWYSIWITLVVVFGVFCLLSPKRLGAVRLNILSVSKSQLVKPKAIFRK